MNKNLKQKYLQHLEDIKTADHNLMCSLYFLYYKVYEKNCMIVCGVPVKFSDFNCFLQFHKDYLKAKNKLFFNTETDIGYVEEEIDRMVEAIDNMQQDQLFQRIILAMDLVGEFNYYNFIEYLKEHPFTETKIIAVNYKRKLEKQVEDLKEEIEELKYGCPHTETRPYISPVDDWVKIYE